ncbi:hypothetical protein JQ557_19450 [Bradyrhizobium sp. U87765 SZCCT0131]|uniref:hypothetical protein n=1 Tax=unclassified Bradyrhizobium TaxID=2631580 RepID=UPI001BAB5447|nr:MULTISPECIES: hypothetical protein [unclassified Bradyrhizobium]MBR1220190.1 hypothetical protein [Bradyrhizobium sp. U87765 SZCCT0131]MBR1263354.1 hypothetical protein [Bradyrhizobium sp. U87765 SZCCT0134]MBR1306763.1 hypothetical protein [Bradyrhizobium sp. U87765 SZCCT0110]MBR1323262.1 hypothetical protein [Bradyrhizobium sp. U87765 SZCCT0109]MBR1345717.1 hypothetical protein [Bradyrhizobium sp. U87765 SZCCT0048]
MAVRVTRAAQGALWALIIALAGVSGARAESVPFICEIMADGESASVMLTNSLGQDASCLASCQFSTAKYDVRPQITCAKTVPAGKEVQMCILPSHGEKLLTLMNGSGDCVR